MSRTLSSAHTHTTFCDGKTPAAETARTAYEMGFVSLGFTSHAPQTFDRPYCIAPECEEEYKAEIRALREEYAGRMQIWLGIERDLLSCAGTEDYDYFIASVHYFTRPDGGFSCVDGSPEDIKSYTEEFCGGDGLETARRYFSLLRDYVLGYDPAVIGHFDLIRKNNSMLGLYDEDSPAYRKMALDALRDMRETHALLEVNTGAIAKGYLTEPYPAPFLLKAWREWGGEVIINSDCHNAAFLDAGYDLSEELLLSLGYGHAVRLSPDPEKGMWERYALR